MDQAAHSEESKKSVYISDQVQTLFIPIGLCVLTTRRWYIHEEQEDASEDDIRRPGIQCWREGFNLGT